MTLLEGVRVVEMTTLLPGPYAGHRLAEMGADVTKVEPPRGDPAEAMDADAYERANAKKTVRRLDLKTDDGRTELHALVRDADVFLTTNRPSTLDRLAASPKHLHDVNPDLVYVLLTGHDDPERIGHDVTYLADAGALGDPPRLPQVPIADLAAAERVVAQAVAGLLARDRQGEGVLVEVCAETVAREWARAADPVASILDATLGYGVYRCADGRWIALGCLEPEHWSSLVQALDRPDWEDRSTVEPEALAAVLADRDRRTWLDVLGEHDVPAAPVRDAPDG